MKNWKTEKPGKKKNEERRKNGYIPAGFFQNKFFFIFFKQSKNKQIKNIIIYLTNIAPSGLKYPNQNCYSGGPSGRPLWGLHFTQILFENFTQVKIPNPSQSRRSPPPFASAVLQQPNPNPNINPLGYVQLGNLKKTKQKRYCQSFYSATKKSQPFWIAPEKIEATLENEKLEKMER